MSNGPFLEVTLNGALPGAELRVQGKATLKVRVQCAPWIDVDRVQVLVNGRPDPALNFTRAASSEGFRTGAEPVRFEREIPLALDRDAHIIVVATGESSRLGPFHGGYASQLPTAVTQPDLYRRGRRRIQAESRYTRRSASRCAPRAGP